MLKKATYNRQSTINPQVCTHTSAHKVLQKYPHFSAKHQPRCDLRAFGWCCKRISMPQDSNSSTNTSVYTSQNSISHHLAGVLYRIFQPNTSQGAIYVHLAGAANAFPCHKIQILQQTQASTPAKTQFRFIWLVSFIAFFSLTPAKVRFTCIWQEATFNAASPSQASRFQVIPAP